MKAQPEKSLFRRLHRIGAAPPVVYDIGAYGWWSAIVSDGLPAGQRHLFGPLWDPPAYNASLQNHHSKHPSWTLRKVTLADSNGIATMQIDDAATGSTILDVGEIPSGRRTVCQYWRIRDARTSCISNNAY